jgi:cell division protease FtsH
MCVVVIGLAVAWSVIRTSGRGQTRLTYSQFLQLVEAGSVASVVIEPGSGANPAICRLKDGNNLRTVLPSDYRDALAAMQDKLVNIEIQDPSSGWIPLLINASPFLVLLAFWLFMMLRLRNGPRLASLG